MFSLAGLTGRLQPHSVDDTPSYVNYSFDSLDAVLRDTRTPGYPFMIRSIMSLVGVGAIPWVQIALHAVASWTLWIELRRWRVALAAASAAALAVALGCTFMDHVSTIATDAPGASIGVMSAVAMMRWARLGQTARAAIPIAVLALLAISFRPAYLALAPWMVLVGLVLRYAPITRDSVKHRFGWMVAPAIVAVGLISWIGLRGWGVGDFGILPFGHQNLAGITIQLVSDDELIATEGRAGELAAEIIRWRDAKIDEGFRFTDGDPASTMTIEGRWNDLIYQTVTPAAMKLHGTDTITNHNAIAELNRDIIKRYPLRYVKWIAMAARRAAWASTADIVMHPIFLLAIGLAVCWQTFRLLTASPIIPAGFEPGLAMLFLVGLSYFVVQIGFVILTSPPLGRFADAAAIFIPAWIAARVVTAFTPVR
ncbi:hypothetical protein Poly51_10310 [Rubripirellula tenax]|uniref:Glycosyltransferase RgtA/B/C/D-like domain-containing protein n=2 Tax=Rubripirellula tenax TaxID=2528015 RepID=A0A5C6FIJ4_9BACT|nr:hypothetical protein Poly51_10310 [Rubripirellula tenax]